VSHGARLPIKIKSKERKHTYNCNIHGLYGRLHRKNIFIRIITDHQPLRVIADSNKREEKIPVDKKIDGFGHSPTQKKAQNTPTVFFLFLFGGRTTYKIR
jgi:hypothetical protein